MTVIIRQDKKVIWTLMPKANAYMEMSLDDLDFRRERKRENMACPALIGNCVFSGRR